MGESLFAAMLDVEEALPGLNIFNAIHLIIRLVSTLVTDVGLISREEIFLVR